MKWYVASLVLLGLITVFTIVSLKGGESMPLLPNGPKAGIGLPSSDIHHSGTFETATFALG
jgi:hypothetical protein